MGNRADDRQRAALIRFFDKAPLPIQQEVTP
jgi:hypothetical protein